MALTATLLRPSATLNLVWSLAIAAWSRSIAVLRSHQNTDRNRSQQLEMPIAQLCWDCTASALRLYSDLRRSSATARSAVVVRSYDCRTCSETVHRAHSDHCEPRPTLLRPAAIGRHCLWKVGRTWPSSLRVSRLVESWRNANVTFVKYSFNCRSHMVHNSWLWRRSSWLL